MNKLDVISKIVIDDRIVEGECSLFKKALDMYNIDEISKMSVRCSKSLPPILHYLSGQYYSDYEVDNDKIEYLLSRKYDVNQVDEKGRTPLAYAVNSRNLTTAIILLEHGADPFHRVDLMHEDGRVVNQTIYSILFDEKGNYYDFVYRNHNEDRRKKGSIGDKRDKKLMQMRLKKIRSLCKPEFEGKELDEHKVITPHKSREIDR